MPPKTAAIEKPVFSEDELSDLHKLLNDQIADHMHRQKLGELPYCKKIPTSIVETWHLVHIFKKTQRTAERKMALARKRAGKKPGDPITVKQFCKATKMDEFTVQRALDLLT